MWIPAAAAPVYGNGSHPVNTTSSAVSTFVLVLYVAFCFKLGMTKRYELSDIQRDRIGNLLPGKVGDRGRTLWTTATSSMECP